MSDSPAFNYFVSAKGVFMVVSLVGKIGEDMPRALETLRAEIAANTEATIFIFNFRDLSDISGDAIPLLAQIQKDLRGRPAEIRLCGLRPELRTKLLSRGVVRTSEFFDNLQTAIQFPPRLLPKKVA